MILFFKKIIGNPTRALSSAIAKIQHFNNIDKLPVIRSGLSDEGYPFLQLENGLVFYGYYPSNFQKVVYTIISLIKFRKGSIKYPYINVAYDIVFRYFGPYKRTCHTDIKKGDVVLEIGAYIGYYAMLAAELVGESGKVIAIEAIKENYDILKKNVRDNNFSNIIVQRYAAWSSKCRLTFFRDNRQRASALQHIVQEKEKEFVDADKIDNILSHIGIEGVDLIRIQVNGAETDVLEGMPNTLRTYPKLLIAAIYATEGQNSNKKIATFLRSIGYSSEFTQGNIIASRIK